jgi:undecaprenyl-diphosphatase
LNLLKALMLGILQGATEFLPISSSGHLVLVPWWLHWQAPPLVFDVVVHLGTVLAVLIYFRRDWQSFARAGIFALRHHSTEDPDTRLLLWLALATLPAALAGGLFEHTFQAAFSDPPLVAAFLLVTALLLIVSEHSYTAERTLHDLNTGDAFTIGVAQAFAIFPGISRSGSTIAAGIYRGMSRQDSARFSFLLGTPIIFGAGFRKILELLIHHVGAGADVNTMSLVVGFVAAGIVGYASIWVLIRLLQRRRLYGFAVYCAAFGTLSLLVALFS